MVFLYFTVAYLCFLNNLNIVGDMAMLLGGINAFAACWAFFKKYSISLEVKKDSEE